MRILVIYAHPRPDSLNSALVEALVSGLEEAGHETVVRDLYAEGFGPVLSGEELVSMKGEPMDAVVAEHQKELEVCEGLAVVHPIWWYGMPAILKGYIDRVFTPGFAYRYRKGIPFPRGLLDIDRALVVNTCDSPGYVMRGLALNIPFKIMKWVILKFCGIGKVKQYLCTGVVFSDESERKRWISEVRELGFTFWDHG